jgi:hypothetical protein
MATTNNIIRFRKEDYKESPSWFDRVIYALNVLVDYTSALGNSISSISTTVSDMATVTSFSFNQLSSATSTTNPETNTYSFANPFTSSPAQLFIYATNSSVPIFTTPVWASWHAANGVVFIDAITGLANSTNYTFTVTLIGQ